MREKHSKANVKAGSTEQEAVKSGNEHVVKPSISHACAMNETFMCPSSESLKQDAVRRLVNIVQRYYGVVTNIFCQEMLICTNILTIFIYA